MSYHLSTHHSPGLLILPALSLFPSFPSPHLIAQPFPVPRAQSLCYAFPVLPYFSTLSILHVSPSHPAPSPNFFSLPFQFSSGSNIPTAWAQWDSGTRWGQALCPQTWQCTAIAGKVRYVPVLEHALCRYIVWGTN